MERRLGSHILGKLTRGVATFNEYGEIVPKAAGWAGRLSTFWGLYLTPSEISCSELDCNHDNVPDYIQRRYEEAFKVPE